MKFKIVLSLVFVFAVNSIYAQGKAERIEKKIAQFEEIKVLLNSGEYKFVAFRALTNKGESINLSSNYNLVSISNSNAKADLPFFGEAYTAVGYTGDGGIKFDGPVIDYRVTEKESKFRVEIRFKVSMPQDLFNCYFSVSNSRNASLIINSNSRSTITYFGTVNELETK